MTYVSLFTEYEESIPANRNRRRRFFGGLATFPPGKEKIAGLRPSLKNWRHTHVAPAELVDSRRRRLSADANAVLG